MNLDFELSRVEDAIDCLKRSSVPPADPLGSPAMPQRDPPSFVRRALAGTVITIALGVMSYSIAVVIFTVIAIGPIAVPLVPLMMFHGKRYLPVCILLSGVAVVLAPIAARARLMRAPFVIVNSIAWGFGAVSLGVVEETLRVLIAQVAAGLVVGCGVALAAIVWSMHGAAMIRRFMMIPPP